MPRASIVRKEVAGIEVVTIPATDYAELMECKRLIGEQSISYDQLNLPSRSVIERNPEVAVFLAQNLGLVPVKELLSRCKRRFGKHRTPSMSAAYRYWERLRKEASKGP